MQKEVNLDSGKLPGYLLLLKTNLTSRLVIIGIRFRYDNLVSRTKETLVRYEVLIPITNQFVFVFVFVFVLAHEQAIKGAKGETQHPSISCCFGSTKTLYQ